MGILRTPKGLGKSSCRWVDNIFSSRHNLLGLCTPTCERHSLIHVAQLSLLQAQHGQRQLWHRVKIVSADSADPITVRAKQSGWGKDIMIPEWSPMRSI
jgi:hypothetical protein